MSQHMTWKNYRQLITNGAVPSDATKSAYAVHLAVPGYCSYVSYVVTSVIHCRRAKLVGQHMYPICNSCTCNIHVLYLHHVDRVHCTYLSFHTLFLFASLHSWTNTLQNHNMGHIFQQRGKVLTYTKGFPPPQSPYIGPSTCACTWTTLCTSQRTPRSRGCFEQFYATKFKVKFMGTVNWFLSIYFAWLFHQDGALSVHLSQWAYAHNIVGVGRHSLLGLNYNPLANPCCSGCCINYIAAAMINEDHIVFIKFCESYQCLIE